MGSGAVVGVDAVPVTVEATLHGATGSPRILGQVDTVVREAFHRIMSAFSTTGIQGPRGIPTINFAPAGIRKSGSGFDLPMALALAGAAGLFPRERARGLTALGEISLLGAVLPARGAVAVALAAGQTERTELLLSAADARLAATVPGVEVRAVESLRDALLWLRGELDLPRAEPAPPDAVTAMVPDLEDIRGHRTPKAALAVAAAGRHNLLFAGPPGSGKSAMLRRLGGILPAPTPAEILEVHKIHSIRTGHEARAARPLRAPHHSSSAAALLGGGPEASPGEVTLAHHGMLFLDELPEFRREALEGLRQPLEDGHITIGRAARTVRLPADFLLVATMNPCPCGYFGHASRPCTCGVGQRLRYRGRISGPLLDRIDLQVDVPALDPEELRAPPDPRGSTAHMACVIQRAVERQRERWRAGGEPVWNGRLADRSLDAAVGTDPRVLDALDRVLTTHLLSGRARVRLLRIARTLADLADRDAVEPVDVLQAARLRGLERSWQA